MLSFPKNELFKKGKYQTDWSLTKVPSLQETSCVISK